MGYSSGFLKNNGNIVIKWALTVRSFTCKCDKEKYPNHQNFHRVPIEHDYKHVRLKNDINETLMYTQKSNVMRKHVYAICEQQRRGVACTSL